MRLLRTLAATLAVATPLLLAPAASARDSHPGRPAGDHGRGPAARIALPDGFRPEGVTIRGTTLYAGSLADGDVYRADVRSGAGSLFIDAPAGRIAVGMTTDQRGRLFVAGGAGTAYVYDTRTGAPLADYTLGTPTGSFINDVTIAPDGAYFTDSFNPVLYRVPFGRRGSLPPSGAAETLTLTGPAADDNRPGEFNLNGIVYVPWARVLVAVNLTTGYLYRIDPDTGASSRVDLGGTLVSSGDGLVLDGHTLYVVQNMLNQIAVVQLGRGATKGTVGSPITSPDFKIPTTAASFGPYLYAVNARFDVAPPGQPADPTLAYDVVRVRKP